jgi:hypothetical protein
MRTFSHWLAELSPADSLDIYRELARSHALEGGDLGKKILLLIERANYRALCEFEIDYSDPSLTAHAVKHCRQALAFFQKLPDLEIGIDKERVGLGKFLEAEELCKSTNSFLKLYRKGDIQIRPCVASVFHSAQRKIARVLGPVPRFEDLDLRFGPGATRRTRKQDASIRRKLAESIQCSEDLLPYASALLEQVPHLSAIHATDSRLEERIDYDADGGFSIITEEVDSVPVEITPAKLSFVPKNAKTHRSICVEPGLNAMFQLGVGDYMAKRLAAFGVDIRDQTLNQRRALEGSLTGELATLDLSSASDTVSHEIVFELLPLDWASFLNRGRSTRVLLPSGKEMRQQKFSSMGNGFTFPLETLIFWGLASACCDQESDATVYGDDIVVPVKAYDLLVEVLTVAGFKVNREKSYRSSPFRESCGKDYFSGIDVRPTYPRGWVSGQALFKLHNFYVRQGDQDRADRVRGYMNPRYVIYGPDGFGDGHLIGDHPRRLPESLRKRGYAGYLFDTYVSVARRDDQPLPSDWSIPLYTVYRRSAERVSVPFGVHPYVYRGTIDIAPLPLPNKGDVKVLTLPGQDGYKKISIYTLGA